MPHICNYALGFNDTLCLGSILNVVKQISFDKAQSLYLVIRRAWVEKKHYCTRNL
jgi:hypothetical protein